MPGNQSTVYALINALMKKNWYVKSACIEALGHIGDKAMSILSHILITDAGEDAAWAVRTKAAWALAAIGEKSIPLLTNALRIMKNRRDAGQDGR